MSAIEFSEVTTDETGTYLAIWKDDKHHSFLIEDVLEAMTDTSTARAIELTGGSVDTLAEALDQWERGREALAELFDENQAFTISFRVYDLTMTLAEQIINAVEIDAQMFMSQKTRDKIAQFRKQIKELEARRNQSREIVADSNNRRNNVQANANP
jgi:hypothetical protein